MRQATTANNTIGGARSRPHSFILCCPQQPQQLQQPQQTKQPQQPQQTKQPQKPQQSQQPQHPQQTQQLQQQYEAEFVLCASFMRSK